MTNFISNVSNKQWKNILMMAAKMSVGCVASILIAYELGLKYPATAGIITILSIQNTKVDTFKTAGRRIISFVFSLLLAWVIFRLFGFRTTSYGCFLLIFVFVFIALGWEAVMSVNAVIVSHFMEVGSMTKADVFNETMIFTIGISMGILMNLHLRKDYKTMKNRFHGMDEEMKRILEHMAELVLINEIEEDSGVYFHELEQQILKAEEIAWHNHHNTIRERVANIKHHVQKNDVPAISTHWDVQYVKMRKNQCEILYEMYKKIGQIQVTPIQAAHISTFLKKMAEEYHEENDVEKLLDALKDLFAEMRGTSLPKERTEFESRAILFVFMLDMKEFLDLKNAFYREKFLQ